MNLAADMMRHEPDDALAIVGRDRETAIGEARSEPVDPQAAVRVEHDFDDLGLVEPGRDCGSERRTQHPGAAARGF